MTTAAEAGAIVKSKKRWSLLRWLAVIFCALFLTAVGVFATTAGGVWIWIRARTAAARQWVDEEVSRIQAAGEPITVDDCYAYQAAQSTPEVTDTWLAVIETIDSHELARDGKSLPVFGDAALE